MDYKKKYEMEELTIEQKAQRYDEILARAKGANMPYYEEDIMSKVKEFVDYLLPELKESEDERIRKAIIEHFANSHSSMYPYKGFTKKQILTWLEKQGEQNLANSAKTCKDEQKPVEWSLPYGKNETAEKLIALAECLEMDGDCLFNGLSGNDYGKFLRVLATELAEVKPAKWSKEDEEMLRRCIIATFEHGYLKESDWLKSLKDWAQPQNLTVTDEELAQAKKGAYNDVLDKIEYDSENPTFDDGWHAAIDCILKNSIIPQSQWKPTEEQLKSLEIACDRNDIVGYRLAQILKELKKLKGK